MLRMIRKIMKQKAYAEYITKGFEVQISFLEKRG